MRRKGKWNALREYIEQYRARCHELNSRSMIGSEMWAPSFHSGETCDRILEEMDRLMVFERQSKYYRRPK